MSDMTLTEAVAIAKNFGKFYRGLEKLAEVAATLEPADQAVREKAAEVARLAGEIETAKTALDAAKDATAEVEENAKAKAAKIVADAEAAAAKKLASADEAVAQAVAKAQEIVADAEAKRDAAQAAAKAAGDELKSTRDRLASLATDVRGMVAQAVGA